MFLCGTNMWAQMSFQTRHWKYEEYNDGVRQGQTFLSNCFDYPGLENDTAIEFQLLLSLNPQHIVAIDYRIITSKVWYL